MTYRINQLSQQISAFGDGDFSVRVHESGNDEISVLARGFNQSAQKLSNLSVPISYCLPTQAMNFAHQLPVFAYKLR